MSQFIDIVELEHHQSNQHTLEAITFTINAYNHCQVLTGTDVFSLMHPLNFLLHETLLPLYINENLTSDHKSLLVTNYSDLFQDLKSFVTNILNVKSAF